MFRLLCAFVSCSSLLVSAAPALVWSGSSGDHASVYTSHEVPASSLLDDDATKLQIVFLLGRGSDGSESLTRKAPFLSGISQNAANFVHNHVSGVESLHSMVSLAGKDKAAVVGLDELGLKFDASYNATTKKARQINNANVLIVNVDSETSPGAIDAAVSNAIPKADRVVLTAVRSIAEVKEERAKITRRRLEIQQNYYRRLEDQQDNGGGDNDQSGIYFVQMTPNILAGLLFFLLFTMIAWIGISCMGMIAAQDTYVKKMPAIGREA